MAVVIKEIAYGLFYVPDFVRYGSKPSRDIPEDDTLEEKIWEHMRSYEECLSYAPHQVFIGNKSPEFLREVQEPWYEHNLDDAKRVGPYGELMPEDEFYAWMKIADEFDLLWLAPEFIEQIRPKVANHPYITEAYLKKLGEGKPLQQIKDKLASGEAEPMTFEGKLVGCIRQDHDKDDTLKPEVLLENLMAKTSGSLTMMRLFDRAGMDPTEVDFVLDCTETAIGDRYNRGGGSMSKAMADMVGCLEATGNDIRAFCCAPVHALVNAAGLVESGIFDKVVVAGGGCLSKVGMKYAAHLKHDMPVLEDVLGSIAFLLTRDDGVSPKMRLDSVGKHAVGAGSPQQAIMTSLILKPLQKLGMKMTDIDKFATEMHNPEITLPAGSGDTPGTNYKIMGALAVINKEIEKDQIETFVQERGMPGFSPTQGHVPAAVPYLGHAIDAMKRGEIKNAMFVAKGSLFLGRMSQLSDGMSFLLEAQEEKK